MRGKGRGLFIEEKSGSGDQGCVDILQFAWLIVANGLHVTNSGRAGGSNRGGREEPTVTDANDFLSLLLCGI
ncbi:hypothetical protein V6N13_004379 [Hibiscus sabdariffa]